MEEQKAEELFDELARICEEHPALTRLQMKRAYYYGYNAALKEAKEIINNSIQKLKGV